jgi:DNA-binding transcriptional LysR family regulator
MTPTQLRAFATVVKLGSVKKAAAALEVSDAAVSLHVGQLRKELGDKLFLRTAEGLAFTPGGLRLASRAMEILGVQGQTVLEVREAGEGRRMLRLSTSSLFAEYAAPGLIELFAERSKDLDVELSIHPPKSFESLLLTRSVDAVIGPRSISSDPAIASEHFLNYQVVAVVSPDHPMARGVPTPSMLREQTWLLGPSMADESGVISRMLGRLGVPAERQRMFQSHAAALEEAKRASGVSLALSFVVAPDIASGSLKQLSGQQTQGQGTWSISTLGGDQAPSAAIELTRFVTTPRATQAMVRGVGAARGRFRPAVHVTLWN